MWGGGAYSLSSICPLWVHRVLQGEYRRLKWKHAEAASVPMLTEAGEPGAGSAEGQQDEELLAEARALRQHKTRLETRMQILEDHNKQLESQLRRLRELLLQVALLWPLADFSEPSCRVCLLTRLHSRCNLPVFQRVHSLFICTLNTNCYCTLILFLFIFILLYWFITTEKS